MFLKKGKEGLSQNVTTPTEELARAKEQGHQGLVAKEHGHEPQAKIAPHSPLSPQTDAQDSCPITPSSVPQSHPILCFVHTFDTSAPLTKEEFIAI